MRYVAKSIFSFSDKKLGELVDTNSVSDRDKRRFKRCTLDTAVAVTCKGQFLVQSCVNISEGGLLVRAFSKYTVGDVIDVSLFVPGGDFVKASGEVVYILEPNPGEHYLGVRFLKASTAAQGSIRRFVETELPN